MSFEAIGSSVFIVNDDQLFNVTGDERFYRARENVWLAREFEGQVFVREPIDWYLPRESADPEMTKLSPNREIERIYATW